MLTDDGDAVPDSNLLLQALRYAKEFGMFFASHCEDPALAGPRAMNQGKKSYELGIDGTPACAEELFIDRDIRLAHAAGAHFISSTCHRAWGWRPFAGGRRWGRR